MSVFNLPDNVGAETVPPKPAGLIETFRAIGYNLPAAVADIIDNSIAAAASVVEVDFHWAAEVSFITITDDGHGMDLEKLVEALRPGAEDPLADRAATDLGRFGLGLKTASFSQCRRVTVISKTQNMPAPVWRGWDLDYVAKKKTWQIINYLSDPAIAALLDNRTSGTVVFLENLDRIVFDQQKRLITQAKFLEALAEVERHLAMVFHRFLEKKRLRIRVNGNEVMPWDPFLVTVNGVQSFPRELYDQEQISIQGYVLPHQSKMTPEKWKAAGTAEGWTARQGFYVYRKDRILVAGDWLGLFRKDDSTKLARIMVEIDAALDLSWQLDIRKSRALPPKMFLDKMRPYALNIRNVAVEVYHHRGKQKQRQAGRTGFEFAWVSKQNGGREQFRVNRNHPLFRAVRDQPGTNKKDLERLVRLLEITLPVTAISTNESLYGDQLPAAATDDQSVKELMMAAYQQLLADGMTPEKAVQELYFIDPFSNYPQLVIQLDEKK